MTVRSTLIRLVVIIWRFCRIRVKIWAQIVRVSIILITLSGDGVQEGDLITGGLVVSTQVTVVVAATSAISSFKNGTDMVPVVVAHDTVVVALTLTVANTTDTIGVVGVAIGLNAPIPVPMSTGKKSVIKCSFLIAVFSWLIL